MSRSKFKESGKTPFGLWVAETLNEYGIPPKTFLTYSGYQQRSLQRLLCGDVTLKSEDFFWIVDSIADLTGRSNGQLYVEVIPMMTDVDWSGSIAKRRGRK